VKQARLHLLVVFVVGVVWLTAMHDVLQNALADMRFGFVTRPASGSVVVVAIDPPSIEKVGTWPWPRSLHGQLIEELESAGVTDIGFDVDFSSPSVPAADDAFLAALKKAGGSIVLPVFKQKVANTGSGPGIHINRPVQAFAENAWLALVNVGTERDGVVRRYPFGATVDGNVLPSMAAMIAGSAKVHDSSFWIDFGIRADTIPVVSYADVLRGNPSVLRALRNKKVIVGGTAVELGDRFTTPHGRIISGPVVQALAAESILQGRDLQRLSDVFAFPGIALLVLCMAATWRRLPPGGRAALLLGLVAGIEAGAALLQAKLPLVLDTSLLDVAIAAYLVVIALDEIDFRGMLSRIADRRFERIAMSLGDGLICADHAGRITLWNPGAEAIFGYAPQDMIGRAVDDIFVADAAGAKRFSLLAVSKAQLQAAGGQLIELTGQRRNGMRFALEACLSGWQGAEGFQYGVLLRDISERKREAEKIRYLAEIDTLTGLPNRNTLHQHLTAALADSQFDDGKVAVLQIDLDGFKEINDLLGHGYGDQVLIAVGEQLKALAGDDGFLARLGGDEFAIVVGGRGAAERADALASKILETFKQGPMPVGGRELVVGASIGIVVYPEDGATTQELLGNVDLALHSAKAEGRGRHEFFHGQLRKDLEARLSLEAEIKRAAENKEFELFYQPQIDLRDGRLVGAEALIRWRHPTRGLVSPGDFIPVVNASPLAHDVGCWVLAAACIQGRAWQERGHHVRIAVNLSPIQLQSGDLSAVVSAVLQATGFSPSLLELEVTEDIVLADEQRALKNFRELQALGVRLAFDDFGTGYAGLSYLKKFPLNVLKIDRGFVAGLCQSADDMAIVAATVTMSRQLGLKVIAEGIEDQGTAEALSMLGCDEGQGFLYGKPMPAPEFEQRFLSGAEVVAAPEPATAA